MSSRSPSTGVLDDGRVNLQEHDSGWRNAYENEALVLRLIFQSQHYMLEHIGSTSIPGISARPVIDIAVELSSLEHFETYSNKLFHAGYTNSRVQLVDGEKLFVFIKEGQGTLPYVVYLSDTHNTVIHRMILFRNYLRNHSEESFLYSLLKENLVRLNPLNPHLYANGKAEFVRAIVKLAKGLSTAGEYERVPVLL